MDGSSHPGWGVVECFMVVHRVFVTWFFYLGIIVSALLAVTAANNLGWIDISGGSEFQSSLDPAGFYSEPSEKAIDALLSEPLALEGGK